MGLLALAATVSCASGFLALGPRVRQESVGFRSGLTRPPTGDDDDGGSRGSPALQRALEVSASLVNSSALGVSRARERFLASHRGRKIADVESSVSARRLLESVVNESSVSEALEASLNALLASTRQRGVAVVRSLELVSELPDVDALASSIAKSTNATSVVMEALSASLAGSNAARGAR